MLYPLYYKSLAEQFFYSSLFTNPLIILPLTLCNINSIWCQSPSFCLCQIKSMTTSSTCCSLSSKSILPPIVPVHHHHLWSVLGRPHLHHLLHSYSAAGTITLVLPSSDSLDCLSVQSLTKFKLPPSNKVKFPVSLPDRMCMCTPHLYPSTMQTIALPLPSFFL